jgi:polyhydroxyalkanoate synthesis regulator phasin
MASLLEKTVLLGLGVLTLTRDKVKEAVDELVEEGQVEPEESPRIVDVLVSKGEKEREELRKLIRQEVESVKPVARREFEELSRKIDELIARLEPSEEESSEEEAD